MNLPTKFFALATLALLSLLANLGHASANEAGVKAPQKWYRVEVIIFTQQDVFADELSSRDIVMNYPQRLIDLDNNRAGFTGLPASDHELAPDAYSLQRTGVYKILFHKAWRQPGLKPSAAPWLKIDVPGADTALNGSLRVYLSSYLHLESNLWHVTYATGQKSSKSQPLNNTALITGDTSPGAAAAMPLLTTPWPRPPAAPAQTLFAEHTLEPIEAAIALLNPVQRDIEEIILLKQASRLKLNKLHYFDHPKMGLLLKVSRSKPAVVTPIIDPVLVAEPKPNTESEPTPETPASDLPEIDTLEKSSTEESPFGSNPALY